MSATAKSRTGSAAAKPAAPSSAKATPGSAKSPAKTAAPASAKSKPGSAATKENKDAAKDKKPAGTKVTLPKLNVAPITNPMLDPRKMRRIIAEDPEWNRPAVPSLTDICIKVIVKNFTTHPVLDRLPDKYRAKVLEQLDVDLPLNVTAPLIADEVYWERCCRARWPSCNIKDHGDSWKQYFFEVNLTEVIEAFVPGTSDEAQLASTLQLSQSMIHSLKLSQLLPPKDGRPEEPDRPSALPENTDLSVDDQDDLVPSNSDGQPSDHLDLGPVFEKLPNLREVAVVYKVKDCGMNFKWSMFGMTSADAQMMADALKYSSRLTRLSLQDSLIDDRKLRVIVTKIIDNPHLEHLDLSHNLIGDKGARALAKLIHGHSKIKELVLTNNQIHGVGAKALAMALHGSESAVQVLNLRLNRLETQGGKAFFEAIKSNKSLKQLNVGSNAMGAGVGKVLSEFLEKNTTLVHLDVSGNEMGVEAGKFFLDGMQANKTLRTLDIRLTKFDKDTEASINQILLTNLKRVV